MQLGAYGAQDIYLTGNPQITFVKVVNRRVENVSIEASQQTLSGASGYGKTQTATIDRNGDLVHKMYVEHTFTPKNAGTDIANNYGVSSAQVAIRWVVDMGFVDVALVGCKTPEQVLTNVNIFDFDINEVDRKALLKLANQ